MSEGAPQPVESSGITYVHRRAARAVGLLAAACYAMPIGTVVHDLFLPPVGPSPLPGYVELFANTTLVAAAIAFVALLVRIAPFASSGTIDRVGDYLAVDVTSALGRRRLRSLVARTGHLVPVGRVVRAELHLTNGDLLNVDTPDPASATAVLRLAGVDAAQQRARIGLTDPIAWVYTYFFLFGFVGAAIGAAVLPLAPLLGRGLGALVWGVATTLLTWLAASFVVMPEITVGTDGVSWRRGPLRRFVPLSAIEDVRSLGSQLELVLAHGRSRKLRSLTGADPARAHALRLRLQEALAARRGEHLPAQLEQLDRRGRSLSDWSQALAGVARAGSSYRAVGLTADDLDTIVASPDTPPERRIGAALALRAAGHPAADARIRVAAAQCASPRLRIALERVGDGAVDLQAIEEALAETEAEGGRADAAPRRG